MTNGSRHTEAAGGGSEEACSIVNQDSSDVQTLSSCQSCFVGSKSMAALSCLFEVLTYPSTAAAGSGRSCCF